VRLRTKTPLTSPHRLPLSNQTTIKPETPNGAQAHPTLEFKTSFLHSPQHIDIKVYLRIAGEAAYRNYQED
jgi:hypothetical protein